MNRERLGKRIQGFSKELDNATLYEVRNLLETRLEVKRKQGRTGWELMTDVEIADLMCKVINKGNGANFYVDLTNLLMFAHALECDPVIIRGVLEEHLGRNYQCRQEAFAKYDTQQAEIDNAKNSIVDETEHEDEYHREEPKDGETYRLRVNGKVCFYKYRYCAPQQEFRQLSKLGVLKPYAPSFKYGDDGLEWRES